MNLSISQVTREGSTHERLVHGLADLVGPVAVDLLEEVVERGVSLQLLVLLLGLNVRHHLVPVTGMERGRRVFGDSHRARG